MFLDVVAEDYIGADAEFDDELMLPAPLALLVAIAFEATPEEVADGSALTAVDPDDYGELWYAGPETRFRQRYKFC